MESGLHYNWHRHHDPGLGRYTQPDPLGVIDGPSVFAYAKSSPTSYVDPDGRLAWWAIPAIVGGLDVGWQLYNNGGDVSCIDWTEVGEVALAGLAVSRAGSFAYTPLFRRGGYFNNNRYLRIGEGRKGGDKVFRAAGDVVEKLTGREHIDFKKLGKWGH